MSNNYNIPDDLERLVRKRDTHCAYCGIRMREYPHKKGTPGDKATFEHIDNDGDPTRDNIVRCCAACNASKGTKSLREWLESDYCMKKGITARTISNDVVLMFLGREKRHVG